MSEKIVGFLLLGGVIGLIIGMCLIYTIIYLPPITEIQLKAVFCFSGGFLAGFFLMSLIKS